MSSVANVKWLKTVLIGMLALVWAAASNHCKLEQIPGLAFLACCQHEDSAPHQDDDCERDSCASFENQLYKLENAQALVGKPTLLSADFLHPPLDELAASRAVHPVPPDPGGLPRVWQFFQRAALPPRAPSLVS